MNQQELTTKALYQLESHTGLIGRVIEYDAMLETGQRADALIQFDNNNAQLVAELKKWAAHGNTATTIEELKEIAGGHEKILIGDFINDEMGARLREEGINYLDKAGNAYLDLPPIYVLIQGKKRKDKLIMPRTSRAFTHTGLKVIFALLAKPDLLNANYREIANQANVSLGTIGWVLRDLKDQGFTLEDKGKREWQDQTRLLKKWVEEYPKLKTKNFLGSYFSSDLDWWKKVELKKYGAVLGGEIAAIAYTDHTEPNVATIYVGPHQQGYLQRELRMVKAGGVYDKFTPNVEVYSHFWGDIQSTFPFDHLTHPLITYADLMDTWDSDKRSLAAQIAEQYLDI